MLLFGDIGGTKTQLMVVPSAGMPPQGVAVYQNTEFQSFEQLLQHYLSQHPLPISSACFCVAGPVKGNSCQMTNLNWSLDGHDLAKRLSLSRVDLINDLTATAYALPVLTEQDFTVLQNSFPVASSGHVAVVSVGTGLGEALLLHSHSGDYQAVASEGGHKPFAAQTKLELELAEYLRSQQQQRFLEVEQLASGSGLLRILSFLKAAYPQWLVDGEASLVMPEQVVAQARNNPSGIAFRALEIFVGIIAAEAASVALQYWSAGGVMIAGGIPIKISDFMSGEIFRQCFAEHPVYGDWLQALPVAICNNYQAPLLGVQYYAGKILNKTVSG